MRSFASHPRSRQGVFAVLLAFSSSLAWAQQTAAPEPPAPESAKAQPAPDDRKANDELLAKAARLYYSTRTAGLNGFDCDVHPDWRTLFSSASKGEAVAEDDARVLTMTPVKIALHARMGGGSTLDWSRPANSGKPLDSDADAMLQQLHQATEQTLQGFMQFWTPFVDGSVVPANSEGLTISRSAADWTIHGEQNGTQVTEVFSNEMILQHFNVVTHGVSIQFAPSYQSTEKGLLVNRFDAHIEPLGQPAAPAQEMHVHVIYATIDGLPIPSRLNLEVIGTGTFDIAMDGCHTLLASK
jgi:hypothetical protein